MKELKDAGHVIIIHSDRGMRQTGGNPGRIMVGSPVDHRLTCGPVYGCSFMGAGNPGSVLRGYSVNTRWAS